MAATTATTGNHPLLRLIIGVENTEIPEILDGLRSR